ncbi:MULTISPECIES: hypothetical protein [Bacillus]|uniref:hypothetical protein n=1 Tax=Bacillus TaxID=1386 RepID=UPI000B4B6218|nr:hypothetical protein [Bacillus cereus]
MEFDKIVTNLQEAHKKYDPILVNRKEIIDEEVNLLLKFVKKIFDFTTKKTINSRECILIYMFPENDNDLISDDVYLSPDGYITYQVYNEIAYKGFVPEAIIENGYVKVPIHYFLENVPLIKIISFFEKRPSILINRSYEIDELNDKRKEFINNLNEML